MAQHRNSDLLGPLVTAGARHAADASRTIGTPSGEWHRSAAG